MGTVEKTEGFIVRERKRRLKAGQLGRRNRED